MNADCRTAVRLSASLLPNCVGREPFPDRRRLLRGCRVRRKREHLDELLDMDLHEGRRMADRLIAGFANRMVESPLRKLGDLIREGRDTEDRQRDPLRRRRRVYPDDDE